VGRSRHLVKIRECNLRQRDRKLSDVSAFRNLSVMCKKSRSGQKKTTYRPPNFCKLAIFRKKGGKTVTARRSRQVQSNRHRDRTAHGRSDRSA